MLPAQIPFSGKCSKQSLQLVLNGIPKPAEKEAQKKPELLPQVHVQNARMNHNFTGFLQLRNDTFQAVPAFPNAKIPFNLTPFAGFLPFQFLLLLLDCRISVGLSKFGTVQVDSVLLSVLHVFPRPEDRICKNPFRIMSVGAPVGLH